MLCTHVLLFALMPHCVAPVHARCPPLPAGDRETLTRHATCMSRAAADIFTAAALKTTIAPRFLRRAGMCMYMQMYKMHIPKKVAFQRFAEESCPSAALNHNT